MKPEQQIIHIMLDMLTSCPVMEMLWVLELVPATSSGDTGFGE